MLGQGTDLFVVTEVRGHSSAAITEDDDGHPGQGTEARGREPYVGAPV